MSFREDNARFERIDWDEVDRSKRHLTTPRITFGIGVAILLAAYLYDTYVAHVYLIGAWRVDPVDWTFLLGVVVLVSFGVVPAVLHREKTARYLRRLLSSPSGIVATAVLVVFVLLGVFGHVLYPRPPIQFNHAYLPPVGLSTDILPVDCVGEVTGPDAFNRVCHGSWEHPLGTNVRGHPMEFLVVEGARVALYVVVFTAAFVIPFAAATGVVAGLHGGLIDDLLMAYVDVQLSIPAIVVYFIGYVYWNPSLLLLLVTFGLLSWGGIARLVRSEVLQRREDGHVMVARSLGASNRYIAWRHILPNVTNTVVPAAFHLMALLVLVEAGVAFLGFHELQVYSWGSTISESINAAVPSQLINRAEHPAYKIWWASTFPAIALTLTMISLKLFGDNLRDALDPRGESR